MSWGASSDCIAIGADHGGYALKQHLKGWLEKQGYRMEDCGTHEGKPCDYPDIAAAVARMVAQGRCRRGIIIDGAGIGSSMMANKFPGVRAALCYDVSSANNSREHNDANVVTLGARLIGEGLAEQIVTTFLTTECREERHLRRVALIGEIASEAAKCEACAPAPTAALAAAAGGYGEGAARGGNFGLAGPAPAKHNAAPDPRAASFQAQAAKWLSMDPPQNMSAPDLERIVARVAELIGGGQVRDGMWCFGDVCVDAHVAREWIASGVGRLSNGLGGPVAADVAGYIDHTLLKPDATRAQVEQLCAEARQHGFASVCVNPYWVPLCAKLLGGTQVKVCTVVGFPLGATPPENKAMEARRAIRQGAREIDMVINIGALKSGDDATVFKDIRAVVDACEDGRALSKVIIETALLSDEEKVRACVAARQARADFVKTSTGFSTGGATAEDVALMSQVVRGARMGVKASGGVRNLADLERMVRAGATRIGASAGIKIVKEASS